MFLDNLMFTVPRWQLQVYHTFQTGLFCSLLVYSSGNFAFLGLYDKQVQKCKIPYGFALFQNGHL